MTNLLIDIANYLKTYNIIAGYEIDTFVDYEPDEPDEAIMLSEYKGSPSQDAVDAIGRSIQITTRSTTYEGARSKAWEIYNLLDNPDDRSVIIGNNRVCIFHPRQVPFKMRVDKSNRIIWGFNMGVITIKDK